MMKLSRSRELTMKMMKHAHFSDQPCNELCVVKIAEAFKSCIPKVISSSEQDQIPAEMQGMQLVSARMSYPVDKTDGHFRQLLNLRYTNGYGYIAMQLEYTGHVMGFTPVQARPDTFFYFAHDVCNVMNELTVAARLAAIYDERWR